MFNLPTRLRIGSSFYKVMLVKDLEADGLCHGGDAWIKIKKYLKAEKNARTLFHEITHLIFEEYDIKLSDEDEERVTVALESGYSSFAKDHQKVFQSMVEEMGKL